MGAEVHTKLAPAITTPYTLNPTPYTLLPEPYTYFLHPKPYILHPKPLYVEYLGYGR